MTSPFKLLEPFTEKERESFFGRNAEIGEQYDLVRRSRLMIVHGLSGTGKTSLLRCGLYNEFDGPDWYPLFVRTGTNVNESIHKALSDALKGDDVSDDNVENIVNLYERTYRPPYLILDQFEEFFILPGNTPKIRTRFMEDIRRLLDTGIEVRVIFVLREEFLAEFYPYEAIVPELFDVRFRVERMNARKVREVVRDSFRQFNIHLEEPVEDNLKLIVENISAEGIIDLPYLQIYLDMLYDAAVAEGNIERRGDGGDPHVTIHKADIVGIGDIKEVLRKFLEGRMERYVRLYRREEHIPTDLAQRILIAMVTDHGTKIPVAIQVASDPDDDDNDIIIPEFNQEDKMFIGDIDERVLSGTIKKLIEQQIIRRRPEAIEIAHDSLAKIIADWKKDEEQHLRVVYRRIRTAYLEYEDSNGKTLMSDSLLDAIDMDRDSLAGLEDKYQEFIRKSLEAREKSRREEEFRQEQLKRERDAALKAEKKANKYRIISIVTGVVLVGISAVVGWLAYDKVQKIADDNERTAEYNMKLAEARKDILDAVDVPAQDGTSDTGLKEAREEMVQDYLIDTVAQEVKEVQFSNKERVVVLPNSFALYPEQVRLEKSNVKSTERFKKGSPIYFYVRLVAKEKTDVAMTVVVRGASLQDAESLITSPIAPNPLGFRFYGYVLLQEAGDFDAVLYEWTETAYGYERTEIDRIQFEVY